MDSTFGIIFGAIFVTNIILTQFLGLCSFLGVSKNLKNSLGMSAAVAFVMILATILSWVIYY
ncbi:MAG: Rnf-Nqr domain containing protein, partial [Acidaminococcaceae bacterium]|nr:Rnf-Nqr domain containing protein [Acidaminococcaceae bacterium]